MLKDFNYILKTTDMETCNEKVKYEHCKFKTY